MNPTKKHQPTILEQAQLLGFELICHNAGTDQEIWEWRRGNEPAPQFVSKRVAVEWMTERLVLPDEPLSES